jgi:hypothetical protein
VKAPSTKQAAEKSASEKGLFTARALPVREPEGEEKIQDEGQGKQHGRNNEQASQLHHGAEEEQEHNEAQSAISCPLSYIVRTRSGNFRRGRIFHLNSGPLTGMGFEEKRKFPVFERQSFCRAALLGRSFNHH